MTEDYKCFAAESADSQKKYCAYFFKKLDDPLVFDELLQFRKRLFVDLYGWDLPVEDERERDLFDQNSTIYCAIFYNSQLIGMFRAIRTDYPYLAATVFCTLGNLKTFPTTSDCWEISRFGVLPTSQTQAQSQILRHSLVNYSAMFYFAKHIQAKKLIAVADLTYERFLASIGIRSRRYGPPQNFGTDREGRPLQIVAGEIPLALQEGDKYQKIIDKIHQVEIKDASEIFRPVQISA